MQELIIDEEFRFLLPALSKETYALLEENILENGCRDAIILWGNIIIDGHNRYEICTKHDIPFNTVRKEFSSRDDALIWIISTQVSRRNLTPIQLSYFRGLHYKADKRSQGNNNRFLQQGTKPQNEVLLGSTSTRLSKQYNVSRATIERDARTADAINAIGNASPEAKRDILAGTTGITRKQLNEVLAGSEDDILDISSRIEGGTFEKKKPQKQADALSVDHVNAGIMKITDDLYSDFRSTAIGGGAELKTALRSYIDSLEVLYRKIG